MRNKAIRNGRLAMINVRDNGEVSNFTYIVRHGAFEPVFIAVKINKTSTEMLATAYFSKPR